MDKNLSKCGTCRNFRYIVDAWDGETICLCNLNRKPVLENDYCNFYEVGEEGDIYGEFFGLGSRFSNIPRERKS